jgi:hypothetical protein
MIDPHRVTENIQAAIREKSSSQAAWIVVKEQAL